MIDKVKLDLIYSEDTQIRYWRSSLFNDVYLRKDLPELYKDLWEADDVSEFQYFMNRLRDLATEYGGQERILEKWSETETINNWIKHVLNGLGWANNCTGIQNPYLEQTSFTHDGKTYRTDILIVDSPKEKQYINKHKNAHEKINEAKESVLIPVEAKYWRRLDQDPKKIEEEKKRNDSKSDDIANVAGPDGQILKYMEIIKKDWGILTDGAIWRLYSREISSEEPGRFFEFNLGRLIQSMLTEANEQDRREVLESAKYFYFFFSKTSFISNAGNEPFVDEILRYSKKYINQVEEDLKIRFVGAMNFACNGFYKQAKKQKAIIALSFIRNVSESALFNTLFIKSLESKNVLPMNDKGYKPISLSKIIDKIECFDPEKDSDINTRNLKRMFGRSNGTSFEFEKNGTELHDKIVRLTKIIHDGQSKKDYFGFGIKGFKESIFSKDEWDFFNKVKLSNYDWVQILFELGYAKSDIRNRKYQQIPYNYFSPRQLGSIYESFLEFQLAKADQDMVFEKKQWKTADFTSNKYRETKLPRVRMGELFFTPDNKERKTTGSYYTPDYIVQYIVKEALGDMSEKSSKEILNMKVCDPAMGSGHFLVVALKYLTSAYLESLADESSGDVKITQSEAKRRVLDACIFGVDINDRAVKLAKMSLWLESANIGYKLERLDDQLKVGDSLVGCMQGYNLSFDWQMQFAQIMKGNRFDAIVGNPPYIYTRNEKIAEDYKSHIYANYIASNKQINTFALFMERGSSLLNRNGTMSFIVPNNWLTISSFSKLRSHMLKTYNQMKIVNILNKVFDDASVDTSIFFAKASGAEQLILEEMKDGQIQFSKKIEKSSIDNDTHIFNISSFKSNTANALLSFLNQNSSTLETISTVSTGLKAYQQGKGKPAQTEEDKNARKFHSRNKESKLHLKYLEGRDVGRYSLKWSGEYLKYGDFLAEPRKSVPFVGPRILVRQIPNKPPYMVHAVYTEDEYLNDINSMIIYDPKNGISLKFILAVINSKIVSEWFEATYNKMQRNIFPQFKVGELKKFPIPLLDLSLKKDLNIHEKIIGLVDILLKRNDWKGSINTEENIQLDEIISELFLRESMGTPRKIVA